MTHSPAEPSGTCAPPIGEAGYSRFFQRLQRRYAQDLVLLPPGAPDKAAMAQAFAALQARGSDTATALRVLRQLVMERLIRLAAGVKARLVQRELCQVRHDGRDVGQRCLLVAVQPHQALHHHLAQDAQCGGDAVAARSKLRFVISDSFV